ncbi:unnamed protein product [Camellia sinensis]
MLTVWRFGCGQRNLKSAIRPPNWRIGENQSATVRSSSRIRLKCGGSDRFAIETTLWSIEWGIAELVNHPQIQKKLRQELDAMLGPGTQITEPDTHNQAVVKETLRLRMAIPLLVPHMNLHDAKLGSYDIPAESKILVNAWWLANNPESRKKPEEFRPERLLEEEAKVEVNGNDFRYLPFGVGRRSCLPRDDTCSADSGYYFGAVGAEF